MWRANVHREFNAGREEELETLKDMVRSGWRKLVDFAGDMPAKIALM
jgi:hypothetical protein